MTDGSRGRIIAEAFLESREFLERITGVWALPAQPTVLERICDAALTYFTRYDEPCGNKIVPLLEEHPNLQEADRQIAVKIVEGVSAVKVNVDAALDYAIEHLRRRMIEQRIKEAQAALLRNDTTGAGQLLSDYAPPSPVTTDWRDPYSESDRWRTAFAAQAESLIPLPGRLGRMVSPAMVRSNFVAFQGSFGSGKSWLLLDLAARAHVRNQLNVGYITIGDMTEAQVRRRLGIRAAGRSDMKKFCGRLLVPVRDCLRNQKDACSKPCRVCNTGLSLENAPCMRDFDSAPLGYRPCTACDECDPSIWYTVREPVDALSAGEAEAAWHAHRSWTGKAQFRILEKSGGGLTPDGLRRELDHLERTEGIVFDALFIDYIDEMAADAKYSEKRLLEDHKWGAMRALARDRHILLVTATQADAQAMTARIMTPVMYSECRRKLDHATDFFGINKSDEDTERGVFRINRMKAREDEVILTDCVTVLRSLQSGRPILDSY